MSGIITAVVGTTVVNGIIQNKAAGDQADAIAAGTDAAIAEQRAARDAAQAAAQPFAELGEGIIGELLSSIGLQESFGGIVGQGEINTEQQANFDTSGRQIQSMIDQFESASPSDRPRILVGINQRLEHQQRIIDEGGVNFTPDQLATRQSSLQFLVDQGDTGAQAQLTNISNQLAPTPGQPALNALAPPPALQAPQAQPLTQIAAPQISALQSPTPDVFDANIQSPQAFGANLASPNALFSGGDQDGLLAGAAQITDFLRTEGFEDIQSSAAARGRLSSGETLKDLNRFNIGLASTVLPQLQAQQFGQQLAGQQFQQGQQAQQFGQQLAGGQFQQGQQGQRFGQQLGVSELERAQNQQQFGQELAAGGFNLGQQGQQFGQQFSLDDLNRLSQNQLFNQNLATQGAAQSQQQQRFNQLFNILGIGANAATGQGNAALQAGGNIGNLQVQAGQAQGNAAINQSNAITNTLGGLAGTVGLFGGFGGGGVSGDFPGANRPQNQAGPFDALGNF